MIIMSKPHIDSLEQALIPLHRDYAWVQQQSTRGTIDRFYSDANQSLRVSYGNIEGYKPADAVTYHCSTNHIGLLYRLKGELDARQYPFPRKSRRYCMNGISPAMSMTVNFPSPFLPMLIMHIKLRVQPCWMHQEI